MELFIQIVGAFVSLTAAVLGSWLYLRLIRSKKQSQKPTEVSYITSSKETIPDRAIDLFTKGLANRYKGDFKDADELLDQALILLKDLATGHIYYRLRISDVYVVKGDIKLAINLPHEAKLFYQEAESYLPKWSKNLDLETQQRFAQVQWAQSRLYLIENQEKAEELLSNSKKILLGIQENTQLDSSQYLSALFGLAVVYRLYGQISLNNKNWQKALDNYEKSLRMAQASHHLHSEAHALLGVSIAKYNLGIYLEAIEYGDRSRKISLKNLFYEPLAISNHTLGKIYLQLKQYENASNAFGQAFITAGKYHVSLLDQITQEFRVLAQPIDFDDREKMIRGIEKLWNQETSLVEKYGDIAINV